MAEKNEAWGSNLPTDAERRVVVVEDAELRVEPSDGDGPGNLRGYAAKFKKWSVDLGGFIERIMPGAFTEAIKDADVRSLKNHDSNLLLGRTTAGTLELEENKTGLQFKNPLPNTTTGRDTAEEVRRGDLSGCSFSFRLAEEGGDEWHYDKDGTVRRTIHKIAKLFDVGPVTFPAYTDTSVALRSLDKFRKVEPTVPQSGTEADGDGTGDETPPEVPTTEALQLSVDGARETVRKREIENDVMRHMPLQGKSDSKE